MKLFKRKPPVIPFLLRDLEWVRLSDNAYRAHDDFSSYGVFRFSPSTVYILHSPVGSSSFKIRNILRYVELNSLDMRVRYE
jgi:hypothetical protein